MSLSNGQFKNVYDLAASREIKKRTGVATGVRMTRPDSPEMVKHEDEAMSMGNPTPKKRSLGDKVLNKIAKELGMDYE